MKLPRSLLAVAGILSLAPWLVGQSLNTELLTNGGFETGDLTGWTTASGTPTVAAYGTTVGTATMPPVAVAQDIGGGTYLIGASTQLVLRQRRDVSGQAGNIDSGLLDASLSAHLGGSSGNTDYGEVVVSFLNSASQVLSSITLERVLPVDRNYSVNLIERRRTVPVPATTRALEVELRTNGSFSPRGYQGCADMLSASLVLRQPPVKRDLDTQLLVNGGFETGVTGDPKHGWAVVAGIAVTPSYGTGTAPPVSVSQEIGGGTRLLHASAECTLSQVVTIAGNAVDVDQGKLQCVLAAALGGVSSTNDQVLVRAHLRNESDQVLETISLPVITPIARRSLPNVVERSRRTLLPAGTRSIQVEIVTSGPVGSKGLYAAADNVTVKLVTFEPPKPRPIDTNLLVNAGFETGRCDGRLADGWTIVAGNPYVFSYGETNRPPVTASQRIGGGTYGLGGGRDVHVEQVVDLSGNAVGIDQSKLDLLIAARLGGVTNSSDNGRFRVGLRNALDQVTEQIVLGPITNLQRNNQTEMLPVVRRVALPSGTRSVLVEWLSDGPTGTYGFYACLDNASIQLTAHQDPPAVPYGVNLLADPSFELSHTTYLLDSGWEHVTTAVGANSYGAPNMPLMDVSQRIGGGARLAYAWGAPMRIQQQVDLRPNAQAIDAGVVGLYLDGYFGGVTTSADDTELVASFVGSANQVLGTATIGRVSNVDRGNQTTLLYREGSFAVPKDTRSLRIELVFLNKTSPSDSNALADKLSAVLFDATQGGPRKYPGTGEDFQLMSGVNALPTGGPGYDVKLAKADDLLTLHLVSLNGTFEKAIPIVLVEAFPTSTPPRGFLPGLHVSPLFQVAWYGGWRGGVLGPDILLRNGNDYRFLIPSGLNGSLMVQAAVFSLKAKNLVFAASDAHELRF